MSTPRELRERFQKEPDRQNPSAIADIRSDVSKILGLTAQELMKEAIISDITTMITKGYRAALEGYILCLSRIINHEKAWEFITEAFRSQNEKVPGKYYRQFGKKENNIPAQTRKTVQ